MTVIGDKAAGLAAFVSTVETGSFSAASEPAWHNALCAIEKCRPARAAAGGKAVPAINTIAHADGRGNGLL